MPPGDAQALYQGWIDESLMPTPDITVPLVLDHFEDGAALAGMEWIGYERGVHTEGTGIRLWIPDLSYLQDEHYGAGELESVHVLFMHEVGHVLDWSLRQRPGALRKPFLRIFGLKAKGDQQKTRVRWWNVAHRKFRWISAGETFADAYARCASPASTGEPRSSPRSRSSSSSTRTGRRSSRPLTARST